LLAHLRRAAVAVSLPIAFAALAQEIPQDEAGFTNYVAEQLRKEVGDATVSIKGSLTLGLGELQANLDRIFAFCKKNTGGCPREIATYVKGAAQVHTDRNAPPVREAIRIIVRTTQYIQQAQGSLPWDAPALQPKPLTEGLVLLPVLDSPRTIRMLTEKDNKALGLTPDEVHQLGLANLRSTLAPLMEVAKVTGHGQIGQILGDSFHPSRLALHGTWAPLSEAQGGNLIVAVPTTDAVLYIGEDTPLAIEALRALVRNVIGRAPNRLSDVLLRWSPAGWELVR
jgi:uncharacterized protein YtpQ (UPF0354 family)